MNHVKLFLCVQAIVCVVTGIKVNMKGSLSLGRDVVESLSHHLGKNILSGRRSLNPSPIEDPITLAVRTALICKDLEFCQDELQHFVNEYIIILVKAVASIMSISESEINNRTYEDQLKQNLEHIRQILEDANAKVEEENETYYWSHVIKRINAKFQNVVDNIKSDIKDVAGVNNTTNKTQGVHNTRSLRHKVIIATAFIERKYHMKLCSEYNICSKSHECTKALTKLLVHFKTMPEDRIRMFVKYFYEALFDTPFYGHLSEETANEFQIILNDMSYSNDTPTRNIMLSVLKTVEARMDMIQSNKGLVVGHEILVAHTILSDVDHMYHNRTDAFTMFFTKFYGWLASGVHLGKDLRSVLSDIAQQISLAEDDLVRKLIDEVKVFLEMTVNVLEK